MKNKYLIITVAAIITMALLTQCESLMPKETKGDIFGVVIDSKSGEPLPDVFVRVKGFPMTAKTDFIGGFELKGLEEGQYSVYVMDANYSEDATDVLVKGGETSYMELPVKLNSEPVGGILAAKVIEYSAKYVKFRLDFFIADDDALVTNIRKSDIDIEDSKFPSGNVYNFSKKSLFLESLDNRGAYSADLVLDQSGSINDTDPNNLRLDAVKIFCSNLANSDYVLLSAFASGGILSYDITKYGDFTNNGKSYFSTIESLKDKVDGGTPLYQATAVAISTVYKEGPTSNKAVVIFTDGEDTEGGWSIPELIDFAVSKGVRIYTVGLSSGINNKVLSRLAVKTGGAFIKAYNAPQLVSAFGTLGRILEGTAQIYSGVWTAHTSDDSFPGWFQTSIKVNYKGEKLYIPFHLDVNAYSKSSKLKHFTNEVITKSID